MRVLVGIGNPGRNYVGTRHNIGFYILDNFAHKLNLDFSPAKSDFWQVESSFDTFHFLLIKPTTYVNNSGLVIKYLLEKYDIKSDDILVIYDDVNLDLGNIRIRQSGSDGGHNGIKSIIYNLQNDKFPRIRFGINAEENDSDLADFVLSKFSSDEIKIIDNKLPLIYDLLKEFIVNGYGKMLDCYSKQTKNKTSNLSQNED
ncbi:MAG: aminoacyl-tRNA hydrolase [Ignavibacteriales bacterium]|nr:aminoacyl-tRNA hydrolase [Ignavibacteriales bacterium]